MSEQEQQITEKLIYLYNQYETLTKLIKFHRDEQIRIQNQIWNLQQKSHELITESLKNK